MISCVNNLYQKTNIFSISERVIHLFFQLTSTSDIKPTDKNKKVFGRVSYYLPSENFAIYAWKRVCLKVQIGLRAPPRKSREDNLKISWLFHWNFWMFYSHIERTSMVCNILKHLKDNGFTFNRQRYHRCIE